MGTECPILCELPLCSCLGTTADWLDRTDWANHCRYPLQASSSSRSGDRHLSLWASTDDRRVRSDAPRGWLSRRVGNPSLICPSSIAPEFLLHTTSRKTMMTIPLRMWR